VLLSAIWTYPLIAKFSQEMVGCGGDRYIFLWNFWWFEQAIKSSSLEVLSCPYLYYPAGTHLAFHSLSWLNCLLAFILKPLFTASQSYNFIFFLSFPLASLAMYSLCRQLKCSISASFMGGLVFSFWGGHTVSYEQLNIASIHWIPIYVLILLLVIARLGQAQKGHLILPGVLLSGVFLLNALSCWYYGYYLLFLSIIMTVGRSVGAIRSGHCKRFMVNLISLVIITSLTTFLSLSFIYGPVLWSSEVIDHTPDVKELESSRVTLATLLLPRLNHPFLGSISATLYSWFGLSAPWGFESSLSFGVVVLIFAIIGFHFLSTKDKYLWSMIFLFFLFLSHGNPLTNASSANGSFFPVNPLKLVPFASFLRVPSRATIICVLVLSILVAQGFTRLRLRSKRRKLLLAGLSCSLILAEYAPQPLCMRPLPHIPDTYRILGKTPSHQAILTLSDRAHEARKSLFFQREHGRPITLGFVSHPGHSAYDSFHLYALLEHLVKNRELPPIHIEFRNGGEQLPSGTTERNHYFLDNRHHLSEILNAYNIEHVSLHPNSWLGNKPATIRCLQDELGPELEYDPHHFLRIYRVPQRKLTDTFIFPGNGFVSYNQARSTLTGRNEATLVIVSDREQLLSLKYRLVAPIGSNINLTSKHPQTSSSWRIQGIRKGKNGFKHSLSLKKGVNLISFKVIDAHNQTHDPYDLDSTYSKPGRNRNTLFTLRKMKLFFRDTPQDH